MPVRVRINGVWSATGSSSGTAPSVPLSVSATSTVVGQIDATWSPPSSAGSSAVSGYTMTATPSGGGTPKTKTVAAPAGGASITGLAQGASYAVTVVAQNGFAAGPASAPITVVVAASAGGNNWLLNPSAHGFPDATNTAPDNGQQFSGNLSQLIGNQTLTAGQSLTNVHIIGKVTLSGTTGVAPVITNCFIDSATNIAIDCSGWTGSNRPQITDSRIKLNNGEASCAVKPGNSDFVRCNISGGQDLVDTGVSGTFTACYIHGCQRNAALTSHNDAFQSLSGSLTVTRCTVTTFFSYADTSDDFNSVFQLGEQSGAVGTILFDTCLLDGGHYAFNANWKSTTPNVDTAWPVGSGFRGPNAFTSTTIKSCRIGPTGQYRNLNWITNSVPPSGSVNRIGNVSDVTGAAI